MSDGEIRVHVRHLRAAKICWAGAREFFATHGIDEREFGLRGVPKSVLEATGDLLALRAVAEAVKEAEARHG